MAWIHRETFNKGRFINIKSNLTYMCKDNTALVSIIIPCYNYGKYIEKCIQSALDQTYKNIEVIVVDNGSTDDSLKKINKFSNNEKIKIIKLDKNIPPGGSSKSAVGIAIKESSGEYISLLYADDWYLKDKIKKQIDLFNSAHSAVGVVYCHGYKYIEKNKELIKWKIQNQGVRGYVFQDYLLKGDIVIPISPLIKRYCYDIIGIDNSYTGSEYDFLVMSQYVDFDFVNDYLVVMRQHENNDAKNVYSVFKRVRDFHTEALLFDNIRSRTGKLAFKRVSRDYLSFGLKFITMLDIDNAKIAIIDSIRIYPLSLLNLKLLLFLIFLIIPVPALKYILGKFNKLSIDHSSNCDW